MIDKIPISEIFGPTLQGEGMLAGTKTHFVRVAGCDGIYKGTGGGNRWCTWCDSMYANTLKGSGYMDTWEYLTAQEVFARVNALPPADWVTLTGGNPALYNLTDLVQLLRRRGMWKVAVETQGTIPAPWLKHCDSVVVSPKPPSAGAVWTEEQWEILGDCIRGATPQVKVVVNNAGDDYVFALEVRSRFPAVLLYLSLVTHLTDTAETLLVRWRWLADAALHDKRLRAVAVLPQLHVLLWGHRRGI